MIILDYIYKSLNKKNYIVYACATYPEFPSNISTMPCVLFFQTWYQHFSTAFVYNWIFLELKSRSYQWLRLSFPKFDLINSNPSQEHAFFGTARTGMGGVDSNPPFDSSKNWYVENSKSTYATITIFFKQIFSFEKGLKIWPF